MPFFSATVPESFVGKERLDKFVSTLDSAMNRSHLKSTLTSLFVNGKIAKLSSKVCANDKIEIEWEENVPTDILPENISISVLYEDEDICVVNKAQGMVVHPASGNWTGTLVSALLFRFGKGAIKNDEIGKRTEILARRRPGIVHRLDKDTSGVIITAKNANAEAFLHEQFCDHRKLVKEYLAICVGVPPTNSGKIEFNIARDSSDRKKFRAVPKNSSGKTALTLYTCIARYSLNGETYSLLRLRLKTGRTHQIRVHLKAIGCPILGDPIYCKKNTRFFKTATLMLHARFLKIRLPSTKEYKDFTAPLPFRFVKVLTILRNNFSKDFSL